MFKASVPIKEDSAFSRLYSLKKFCECISPLLLFTAFHGKLASDMGMRRPHNEPNDSYVIIAK